MIETSQNVLSLRTKSNNNPITNVIKANISFFFRLTLKLNKKSGAKVTSKVHSFSTGAHLNLKTARKNCKIIVLRQT